MSGRPNALKGKYQPVNEDKYKGNIDNIVFRSSWELMFCKFLDGNTNVKYWSSESVVISYISPKDNLPHRYFPDFLVTFTDGTKVLIEVKPYAESIPPKEQKRKTAQYLEKWMTFAVNQAKWASAREYCKKYGMTFQVFTEHELKSIGIPMIKTPLSPKK